MKAVGVPYRGAGSLPRAASTAGPRALGVRPRRDRLPHNSYALYGEGRRVAAARMEPGDVLFFEGLGHVGLYLGRGRMVHAPQTGRDVEVIRLDGSNYGSRLIGARRVTSA